MGIVDGGFAHAIRIEQFGVLPAEELESTIFVYCPTVRTDDNRLHEVEAQSMLLQMTGEGSQRGWDELGPVDLLIDHQVVELRGIQHELPRTEHHLLAEAKRSHEILGE